jgi:endonuclease/exonuclease/phosphatase family metal-dependent hydrolase
LRAIGRELAARRAAGRQPDVVLIQEGFRGEIADLVRVSGYRFWAQGPRRSDRPPARPRNTQGDYRKVRYPLAGEGWGKFTGSGLHVLSDLPIVEVRSEAYRNCAGLDCLANKGVMLVRVELPDGAGVADIVNTHMNAKGASRTPLARTLQAHNLQTEQLLTFIKREHAVDVPLLVGGDFNVKGAPARYAYDAAARPYTVVSEYCDAVDARCEGQAPAAASKPWLRSQDLQAFHPGGPVDVRPMVVATLFDKTRGERALSDHAAYLVRYQLDWSAGLSPPPVQVKPTLGSWGVKVSWRR